MNMVNQFMILVIFYFVLMMIWRIRNGKKTRDNILCEFATDEGTGYEEFHPVKEGILTIEPSKKRAGAEYPIGNVNTITVDYPQHVPFFLSLIQVKVKKTWIDEQTAEPVLNRSNTLNLTPQRIYNRDRERFTALATGQSIIEEKAALNQVKKGSGGLSTSWIVALMITGVLLAGLFVFKDYLAAAIATSNAALGLP